MNHLKLFNRLMIFIYTGTIIITQASSRSTKTTNEAVNLDDPRVGRTNTNLTTDADNEENNSQDIDNSRILVTIQQQFKLNEFEILTKRGVTSEMFTNVLVHFGTDSDDNSLVSIYKAADWAETGGEYYSFSSSVQSSLPITFKISTIMQLYRMGTHRSAILLKTGANYILTSPESDQISLANYVKERQAWHDMKLKLNKQEINFEHEQKLWEGSLFAHPHVDPMVQSWHRDKVVLDVIVGLPVMAIEAAKFGASKVYVIRPNAKMANIAQKLINDNSAQPEDESWRSNIRVIVGDIRAVKVEEGVDLIFTEAVGVTQYYEQVYKINIHAARWLKKDGVLLPIETKFFIAPFTDAAMYDELQSRANFWSDNVSVVRLKSLYNDAKNAIFSQQFRIDSDITDVKMAKENQFRVTFSEDNINYDNIMSMRKELSLKFAVEKDGYIHGLAFWFDATFMTEKYMPSFSSKLYLQNRLETEKGDEVVGKVVLLASTEGTYDLTIELKIEGKPETEFIQLVNLEKKYEF